MFFSLTTSIDKRFPFQHQLGNLVLNVDAGWQTYSDYRYDNVYKGYCDAESLELLTHRHDIGSVAGNFCIFRYDRNQGTVQMITDHLRSFICWFEDNTRLSNLDKTDHTIWPDRDLEINQQMHLRDWGKDLIGDIDITPISLEDALQRVDNILHSKVKSFVEHNRLPLKVQVTGGVDTMLVYSYIDRVTKDYEMIFEDHVEWDYFYCKNKKQLKTFWGYTQLNHWREPCVLASGAPGDEFMMRGPEHVLNWAAYFDIDMNQAYRAKDYRYKHEPYFATKDFTVDTDKLELSPEDFVRHWLNLLANDCQHWHLGNTLTFTPLRDIDILKTLMRLKPADIAGQFAGAEFTVELIKRNNPELIQYLSCKKNLGESLENLPSLIESMT